MYTLDEIFQVLKNDEVVLRLVEKYGASNLLVKTVMKDVLIVQSRVQKDILTVIEIPHPAELDFVLSEMYND